MRIALAAEVRGELAAQGMRLEELEGRAGVEHTSMWRYLSAKRAMPLDTLVAIAEGLGLSPSELLQRAEQRARRNPQPGGGEH